MNDAVITTLQHDSGSPRVNTITLDHPWRWLAAGWDDLTHAPTFSLAYGAVFTLVGILLTMGLVYEDLFFVIPLLAAGFFLLTPLLGIGLYQISETLEQGERLEFCQALRAWRRNEVHLAGMGVTLVLILMGWMMAASLVFALLFEGSLPTGANFVAEVFLSGDNTLFLLTGTAVGAAIAAFTFSITVVSVPMLMDRQVDVVTAMHTSFEAVRNNWRPMALWAALIVMCVGFGIVTLYLGLIVAMPVVGHATWHAYKDLVPRDSLP